MRWGYNYDFIPDINSKNKLTWNRTESSVKIHIADAWYNHIEDEREQDCGYTKEEFYNPRKCTSFQYQIPTYTSDIEFALEYIKNVIDKNIPLIREWINNVQTVDDAITVLNQRIVTLPHIYVPYMCHISFDFLSDSKVWGVYLRRCKRLTSGTTATAIFVGNIVSNRNSDRDTYYYGWSKSWTSSDKRLLQLFHLLWTVGRGSYCKWSHATGKSHLGSRCQA